MAEIEAGMPQGVRLTGAVFYACGFVNAMKPQSRVDELESVFLDFHDNLKEVVEQLGPQFIEEMNVSFAVKRYSEDELRQALAFVSTIRGAVEKLGSSREILREKHEGLVATYWSQELQDQLLEFEDGLEDLEETITLGLSPEFRREIGVAMEEANAITDRAFKRA